MVEETAPKKVCFVVGPVGEIETDRRNHADLLLEFIIKPVMDRFSNFVVRRQDKDSKPGMIDSQIIIALKDSDLVIADLSFVNPNAFYEIGIRHMVAKPIIHMQLEEQKIPFDLSLYKTVPFSFLNPSTYKKAQDDLRAQVTEAVSDEYKVDNPVTRALGQAHFEQNASPAMKVLMDQMGAMNSRLNFLDGFVRSFSGDAHKQYTENMAMVKALFALPPGSLLIQLKLSHLFEGSNLKTLLPPPENLWAI